MPLVNMMLFLNYDVIWLLPIMMLLMIMMVFCIIIKIYDHNDVALRAPHVEIEGFYLVRSL